VTVLVCIPFYGAPELLNRAAASVLNQTLGDLELVVVGDGVDPIATGALHPSSYLDDRCQVYVLPENRGPYFAQHVALLASPHAWYAPVGADDWIEPDHLERLIAVGGDAVITGAAWWHEYDREPYVKESGLEVGLFARDRLLSIGGHNPAERMGQDTLMIRLLRITGELRATHHPTYHRIKRSGSLTTARATRHGSTARNEMRARNRRVFAECECRRDVGPIKAYRESIVPAVIADEVREHAARLAERLGKAVAA
jgi:glycosyltransferase involved in cell wall biosynthesis